MAGALDRQEDVRHTGFHAMARNRAASDLLRLPPLGTWWHKRKLRVFARCAFAHRKRQICSTSSVGGGRVYLISAIECSCTSFLADRRQGRVVIAQGVALTRRRVGNHSVEHRPEKLYRRWELRLCVCGDLYNCFHVLFCVATVKQVVHLLSCLLITLQICPCIGLNQGYNAGTAFAPVFNRLFNSRFGGKIMLGLISFSLI